MTVGKVAATAAVAAAAALSSLVIKGAEAADAIGDAADRMGVAVESLSRLKFAAEQNDVTFDALTTSIKRWQVLLSSAASGQKQAADSLGLIGLKASDLKGLNLEDQLAKIADQFRRIQDPVDRTRVAVELFGRSGEQLVPLLAKGGQALRDFAKDADEAGITLDGVTAKRVDVALKRWEKLKTVMESFGARTAGAIAGAFGVFGDEIDKQQTHLEELIKLRDDFARGFNSVGQEMGDDPYRAKQIEELNKQIEATRLSLSRLKGDLGHSGHGAIKGLLPLEIPIDDTQTKKLMGSLEMIRVSESLLADPLIQWEKDTRTAAEKVAREFEEFQVKLDQLVKNGKISGEEASKRSTEQLDDILQPIQISVQRIAIPLTQAQERAKAFTDTLKEGLDNAARSGETTGKAILRNLLAAFESKILYNAIDNLSNYIGNALLKASAGGSGKAGFLGTLAGIFLGHAAGGGRMSGPRIVGEEGPELDLGGGQIMNRRQLAFAMAGTGTTVQMGDTNITVQGNADDRVLQAMEVRIQQNNKKQLENFSRLLQQNGYKALR